MGSKPSTPKKPNTSKSKNGAISGKNTLKPGETSQRPSSAPQTEDKKDLMISYSHQDKEMMARLRDNLESSGISVWVDVVGLQAGVDFLSKIGQAIIDAKLFVTLLSPASIKSKYCKDEVALAYISQKAIFPVAVCKRDVLLKEMDTGMRLQLANIPWFYFLDEANFDADFQNILSKMKQELDSQKQEKDADSEQAEDGKTKKRLKRKKSAYFRSVSEESDTQNETEDPESYWTKTYGKSDMVSTERFMTDIKKHFDRLLKSLCTNEETEWLITNLQQEIDIDDDLEGMVLKENFINFCKVDGEVQLLWPRIQDYSSEMFAIREVFSMDSSVRLDAIENLGRFQSNQVIESLRDLLRDKNSNVRSVAAVSLARTGNKDNTTIKHLMKCLNDKDRLVREAGCLALGNLGSKEAVPKLLHLWRNDFISHVREAAQAALLQIGGPEVDKAMHITKVLAEEIRMLTEET